MAWSSPMTAVVNATFTAAQYNTFVRDNLLETMPAKATVAGSWFVSTGANAIVQRTPATAIVATGETRATNTYGDLATVGPSVSIATGQRAFVWISASIQGVTNANIEGYMSYAVSGATSHAETDNRAIVYRAVNINQAARLGTGILHTNMTPGTNVFTAKYKASGTSASFVDRRISVLPL